ncbi:glycosyltransferase family A protein [Shimia thalassica]|uniref:glycosyltransferase family 2 protein n=1 Tax=Shimia thalassica TaxID=1715693 RepID=UPI0026E3A9EC|nr:glycosyltransferase family A protein [Shimia thalassica]MDO6523492.1 glycosyltransferase family A protein [Shimia thalassica]
MANEISVDRWNPEFVSGRNAIAIAENLELQWKPVKEKGFLEQPSCRSVTVDGKTLLELRAGEGTSWTRLKIPVKREDEKTLFTVKVLIKSDDIKTKSSVVTTLLARFRNADAQATWLEPLEITRPKKEMAIRPGSWYSLTGAFVDRAEGSKEVSAVLINLPKSGTYHIARIDIDWLDGDETGSGSNHELEIISGFSVRPAAENQITQDWFVEVEPSVGEVSEALSLLPRDPKKLGTALILQAHSKVHFELLTRFVKWALANETNLDDRSDPLSILLRRHVDPSADSLMTDLDLHILRQIWKAICEGSGFGQPRMIVPKFGPRAQAASKGWPEIYNHTSVGYDLEQFPLNVTQELSITRNLQFSPFAVAFLASSEATIVGADISIVQQGPGWQKKIHNFPEHGEKSIEIVASLSGVEGVDKTKCGTKFRFVISENVGTQSVCLDDAYALILKLDASADVSGLTNFDKCICFDSLQKLQDSLPKLHARLVSKPVIVIGDAEVNQPDYIVSAVGQHWKHAGRAIVSPFVCSYNSDNGSVGLRLVDQPTICNFAFARAITSMPLSDVYKLESIDDIMCDAESLFVAIPTSSTNIQDKLEELSRLLSAKKITLNQRERLALQTSFESIFSLSKIDQDLYWSTAPIIQPIRRKHDRLHSDLRDFESSSNQIELANNIIENVKDLHPYDRYCLNWEIDLFSEMLSRDITLLLGIKQRNLLDYFKMVRNSEIVDKVCVNLMPVAVPICQSDTGSIIPLFELLSCGLSFDEINFVLNACIGHCSFEQGKVRYTNRIASCCSRFGSQLTLFSFLSVLHEMNTKPQDDNSIYAHFSTFLTSDYLGPAKAHFGEKAILKIRNAIDSKEKFLKAIVEHDRDQAIAIARNEFTDDSVNFLDLMDSLRSLSNELRELKIPVKSIALEGVDRNTRKKMAATVFSDIEALRTLKSNGYLSSNDTLDAVALNILGENHSLNEMIKARFANTPHIPIKIVGDSICEVFSSAQRELSIAPVANAGPLVSVIMSAFEPDLSLMKAALDSLTMQTHQEIEIIVIDDASCKEAASGIRALVDDCDKATLLSLNVNSGPYVGRNLALDIAKGDFIAIHDSDDFAHPQLFEAQLEAFEEGSEIRLVSSEHIRVDKAGCVQLERNFEIFGDGPMTSMFRRSIFDEIGKFAEVRSRGDVEMRERLRSFYGGHAIKALPIPMKLCFADSSTLSQRTAHNYSEYLQQWRSNISIRPHLGSFRVENGEISAPYHITIPKTLRAPKIEKPQK